MKKLLLALTLLTCVTSQPLLAVGNAADYEQSAWDKKVSDYTQMTGKVYEYAVSGYRIKLTFTSETSIDWERLEAPDDTKGLKGSQKIDRQNIHPGIFVMAWSEDDGSSVIDIVDIQRLKLFANFVMPDGKRYQTQAALEEK
jgi:hypothetical protein